MRNWRRWRCARASIWGPGDQQLVPRLAERARQGRLRFVGDGLNKVDTTYIDNAAQAHFDAFEHLAIGAACAGKAYFISNGELLPMRELLNKLLAAMGAPMVEKSISFKAAYRIGAVCEKAWPLLRLRGEPPMTRFSRRTAVHAALVFDGAGAARFRLCRRCRLRCLRWLRASVQPAG